MGIPWASKRSPALAGGLAVGGEQGAHLAPHRGQAKKRDWPLQPPLPYYEAGQAQTAQKPIGGGSPHPGQPTPLLEQTRVHQ